MIVIIFLCLAAGFSLVLFQVFRLPSLKVASALASITQHERRESRTWKALMLQLSVRISKWVRLGHERRERMAASLSCANLTVTPELYIAQAIASAVVKLPLLALGMVTPLTIPLILLWIGLDISKDIRSVTVKIKKKRERIENELSHFVETVTQELRSNRNITAMLEGYKPSAGPDFRKELEITIADMKSGSQEVALKRLETRVGSVMLSEVVRGLLAVLNGDSGIYHFELMSHDFRMQRRQRLEREALKRPQKAKIYPMLVAVCIMATYFFVMFMQIIDSGGQLF